jgi:hypothetical protein
VRDRPQIKDNGDGTMSVTFVPTVVGELPLNMQIDGKNIQVGFSLVAFRFVFWSFDIVYLFSSFLFFRLDDSFFIS